MNRNESYYCFINEKKLTEAEWNTQHEIEIKDNPDWNVWGLWHLDSYEMYAREFDKCMAMQIENRDALRRIYVELMNDPFDAKWVENVGNFNESFKACYGVSPWFYDEMLKAKGKTREDVRAYWEKEVV